MQYIELTKIALGVSENSTNLIDNLNVSQLEKALDGLR